MTHQAAEPLAESEKGIAEVWTAADLTPDVVTDQLVAAGVLRGARVVSVEVADLDGPGMTGDLRRLVLGYDRVEDGAPASLIAKCSATMPEAREIVHSMGFYAREAGFYRELAASSVVRVPQCYFGGVDQASGQSLLLLEDLSDGIGLSSRRGVTVGEAEAIIAELAVLHARWWSDARLPTLPWLRLQGFTAIDQVGPAFAYAWASFLSRLSVEVSANTLALGDYGARYLPAVAAHLHAAAPLTLVHNDVQGDNILLSVDDRRSPILIDWQLATTGRGPIDVAALLGANLQVEDRRQHEDELLARYHALLVDNGVTGYSFEQCRIDYRLALLPAATRFAGAIGVHPALEASPGAFWNDIWPRHVAALVDNDVAGLCRDLFD